MPRIRTIAIALDLSFPFEWHYQIYAGTQRYAEQAGWRCVVDEFPEQALANRPKSASLPYNGVISRTRRALFTCANRLGVPVVNTWYSSPVRKLVPGVYADHQEAGRLCAEHLLQHQFRRFGFDQFTNVPNSEEMRRVFTRHVQAVGCTCRSLTLPGSGFEDGKVWYQSLNVIRDWLSELEPPVGIFASQGNLARQLVHLCEEIGYSVPRQAAIISGENESVICDKPPPSLTSIDYDWEGIGYKAAQLLNRLMDGESPPTAPIKHLPRGMLPRASTGFFAVEDEIAAEALRYISGHLSSSLSSDEIAAAIATTPRTLRRRFQEHLGRSVSAEIRRLRIELAKRMLTERNDSIEKIARESGFGSGNRMREVFSRELGLSPGEYRKKLRVQ